MPDKDETSLVIEGVKHVFKHCNACESMRPLIDELYKHKAIIDKVKMLTNDAIYISAMPEADHRSFEHPLQKYQTKIYKIRELLGHD